MRCPKKAFVISILWICVFSCAVYFGLKLLFEKFVPWLLPFVFVLTILIFVILFYICAVYFKTFFAEIVGDKLSSKWGFLIKRSFYTELKRVQSVKTVSTPLMRFMGLNNLLIIFDGRVLLMPLLRVKNSEEIIEKIRTLRNENEEI